MRHHPAQKVIVLGYIVRGPLGGLAWHHLQYVLSLHKMGYEVLYVEDSDDFAGCYNPETYQLSEDPSFGLQFINSLFKTFDLQNNWAYFDAHTNTWFGRSKTYTSAFATSTDLVINLSGVNPVREWWAKIPVRAFIDTDPGFTQIKHLTNANLKQLALYHTHFFTYAENYGKPACSIPNDGFKWQPTRQPLFADAWKISDPMPGGNWTTIMQWDSYKEQSYNGLKLGMKSKSFEAFLKLPDRIPGQKFELALGSKGAPKTILQQNNWLISDPYEATKDANVFQNYIARSKGEWTVAKHGYASTNSGWFSERSLNYLASGKPVITQETGFSDFLPVGMGLLSFNTIEETVDCIEMVNANYLTHCKQARILAEEYFEGTKVLEKLINGL